MNCSQVCLEAAWKLRVEAKTDKPAVPCRFLCAVEAHVISQTWTFLVSILWRCLIWLLGEFFWSYLLPFYFLVFMWEKHQDDLLLHALRKAMAHYTLVSLRLNVCSDCSWSFGTIFLFCNICRFFYLKYRLQLICSQHPCITNSLFLNSHTIVDLAVKWETSLCCL